MPPFQLVIRNGTIVDGTGADAYRGDIGISDGVIAKIGRIADPGRHEIDAEGHVVSPGFIDGHTHMDAQVMWDELGTCSCWHGVTTVVMGNCGFTLAPAHAAERALVVRNLERAEDISPAALAEGLEWSWETFAEYLDTVDRRPKAINYAAYIGHSALRTWAMGERAFDGPADDDDLVAMEHELLDALDAGAVGFTTSRSDSHQTSDDRPVASRLASWDEVRRLVSTMGQAGGGIFEIAQESSAHSEHRSERIDFYQRMQALALDTGVSCTFYVQPNADETAWKDELDLIDGTVAAGGRMFGQASSRGISLVSSFKTRLPFDSLPGWSAVRRLPLTEQRRAFRDAATVEALVEEGRRGAYGRRVGAGAQPPVFDRLAVLDTPLPPHATVASIAAARGIDPIRAMIELALESDFDQLFVQPITESNDDATLAIMRHPGTVMTFSDSGAHVSQIVDCSIHTHLLGYWVREREACTLEQAVQLVTTRPARAWGFRDRGEVREGWVADLNVFDPLTVGPAMPEVAYDLPGGVPRLKQQSTGFLATVVGGQVTLRHGQATGALPGRLLRFASQGARRGSA